MDELSNVFGSAEQLWQYIKVYAAKAGKGATRVVLELYYVMKSPETPAMDKTIIIAALGYQLLPNDLMSRKKYGWLGFLDNGAALALAYSRVKKRVTPQIEAQVSAILNQWFGTGDDDATQQDFLNEDSQHDWSPQYSDPISTLRTIPPAKEYGDDEEVIID